MRRNLFAILVLLLFPLHAYAEGSVSFRDDVSPLLAPKPALAKKLDGLTLDATGEGLRIGWRVCPALAGQRVGPYEFTATDAGGARLQVLFHTRDRFLDASGTVIAQYLDGLPVYGDDLSAAVKVDEELEDITFPD